MSFTNFDLNVKLTKSVAALGYQQPTPIQSEAIPVVLEGRDVIGLAQTGTGKTAAFLLPVLHKILSSETRGVPQALVIAPTRELVDQIFQSAKDLSKYTDIKMMTMFGGAPMPAQLRHLKRGVDIIIACPGRLLDHIQRKTLDPSTLHTLILDEADHMFDMGFLPVIREINSHLPTERQTLLFTATMPKEIRRFTEELTSNPLTIRVGRDSGLAKTVSHNMYSVGDGQKKGLLLEVVNKIGKGSAIVFTRTKRRAKGLDEFLKASGAEVTSLQGNLSQSKRRDAIDGFRTGKYKVLVATDIAARGIDVSRVSHVVNFDMPDTVEAYTHRTGRTGRADSLGDAVSFATATDRQIIGRIKAQLSLTFTELPMPGGLPKAPSSQKRPDEQKGPRRGKRPVRGGQRNQSRGRRNYRGSRRSSAREAV